MSGGRLRLVVFAVSVYTGSEAPSSTEIARRNPIMKIDAQGTPGVIPAVVLNSRLPYGTETPSLH